MSRFSLLKQPEESVRVRLELTSQNKMKAVIVLLVAATAAFAYGASNLNLLFIISEIKGLYTETVNTVRHSVS